MVHQSINWQPQTLKDTVVKLVPLTELDFEALYAVASDPVIWEQHPEKDRYKKEVFQQFFDAALACGTTFVIQDISCNKIIGSARYYQYRPGNSSIAIGYTFLATSYWGGTYNKAIKTLLLNYAFQFVNKVYFHIAVANIRSQKAILKIGAIKVGAIQLETGNKMVPHFEYLIEKHRWARYSS